MPDTHTLDMPVAEQSGSYTSDSTYTGAPERKPKGNTKKIVIAIVVLLVLGGIITASVRSSQNNLVTVTTAKVVHEDISSVVTGSGEIKPKTYVNIGAQGF